MVNISIYPILDESLFINRELNHDIYREIYEDLIYDEYEDVVHVLDFVFKEDPFENRSRAKLGRNHFDEDFVQNLNNLLRANFVQKRICEDSSYKQICEKIVQNKLLKIRGRFFMGKRFGFEDYDQNSRTNLLQPGENDAENIWIYSKYYYYLLIG